MRLINCIIIKWDMFMFGYGLILWFVFCYCFLWGYDKVFFLMKDRGVGCFFLFVILCRLLVSKLWNSL